MKLSNVQIKEFQSIIDSNEFEVDSITCLVGKNEAGKTSSLKALYRLNPIIESDGKFDVTDDYPRKDVEDYKQDVENEIRQPAEVIRATFILDQEELNSIRAELGPNSISNTTKLVLTKGYGDTDGSFSFILDINGKEALLHLMKGAQLPAKMLSSISSFDNIEDVQAELSKQEETTEIERLKALFSKIISRDFNGYVFDTYLRKQVPKFLYFDEYYQMRGYENIEALIQRQINDTLEMSDHPLLGLVNLARLALDSLIKTQRTQELKNSLEGAGNHLTKQIIKYWSQNKHIQMRFDVRPASPQDPEGLRTGTNIWADIYDSRHMVTTSVGNRSRGFVWFFSFLAWYSQIKKEKQKVILLLDEPGLSLHAKAQGDLLRYFEKELHGQHQLIYTTHSPFMVDPKHFERVRIVQDKGIDSADILPEEEQGTKIFTDLFQANNDSLFPLQGALGYEIYQTLFIGPNNLVVEGVSDLLYIQTISSILAAAGRESLSNKWTITPVGGSDKIPTFVALLGNQQGMNVATLIDIQSKDFQTIENLYKKKLLKKSHVLTFADFTGATEADIEDVFGDTFYLKLVNAEFKNDLQETVTKTLFAEKHPRILVKLKKYFSTKPLKNSVQFTHYRPARYFSENSTKLATSLSSDSLDRFEEAFKKLNSLV
jgi:predicted ATP-dependent endonuclease of OLD family